MTNERPAFVAAYLITWARSGFNPVVAWWIQSAIAIAICNVPHARNHPGRSPTYYSFAQFVSELRNVAILYTPHSRSGLRAGERRRPGTGLRSWKGRDEKWDRIPSGIDVVAAYERRRFADAAKSISGATTIFVLFRKSFSRLWNVWECRISVCQ